MKQILEKGNVQETTVRSFSACSPLSSLLRPCNCGEKWRELVAGNDKEANVKECSTCRIRSVWVTRTYLTVLRLHTESGIKGLLSLRCTQMSILKLESVIESLIISMKKMRLIKSES